MTNRRDQQAASTFRDCATTSSWVAERCTESGPALPINSAEMATCILACSAGTPTLSSHRTIFKVSNGIAGMDISDFNSPRTVHHCLKMLRPATRKR